SFLVSVLLCVFFFFFFFFSSRRRHTRWPRDWSSDVCSSDLGARLLTLTNAARRAGAPAGAAGPCGRGSAAAARPPAAPHAALAQLLLESRGNELHHGDAALHAEELDLAMESFRDPRGELDQDVIVFGHRGHPPSAPACAGCYLTYLGT